MSKPHIFATQDSLKVMGLSNDEIRELYDPMAKLGMRYFKGRRAVISMFPTRFGCSVGSISVNAKDSVIIHEPR